MPKFVTIGYGDRAGYDRTPEAVRSQAHDFDAQLKQDGALVGIAGTPVQVRNPDARGVDIRHGAYASTPLPVAGFAIIEAADMEEAIRMMAQVPCAVAHGVVEIWPLEEPDSTPGDS